MTRKERKEYNKQWRANNPIKVNKQKERHYAKYKEKIKAYARNHYHTIQKIRHQNDPEYQTKVYEANQRKKHSWNKFLLELRMEHGGKCSNCGYNDEIRILQFHHIGEKTMDVVLTRNRKRAIEEAKKCKLLCPNCHALTHLTKIHEYS